DTSATTRPQAQTQDSTLAWTINFPNTTLDLKRADIFYQDDPGGILLDGKLGALFLRSNQIDLRKQLFQMDKAEIQHAVIYLALREPTTPPDTIASTAGRPAIEISSKTLSISETAFRMKSETLDLDLDLPKAG